MLIGISAAVAAAAFAVLAVYLITLIQTAKRSLDHTNETLNLIRTEIESVRIQSVSLMAAGEKLVKEAEAKLHTLDPIASSVKQTGEAIEQVTTSMKEVSAAVSRSASGIGQTLERNTVRFSEIAEYAAMGVQLWQKWQSHRTAKAASKAQVQTMEE
ncbi:DUF948 domain-containing protein [Gorillibacterium sp. sgz5001074]|uniref:DUF948 domain-containing protein n=1 Tax=Gorillibacterium sp. sgz5001074 TaxID=3446695 RepID=UPI003F6753E2